MRSDRHLQIDEEGYFISNHLRVSDLKYGHELMSHMTVTETSSIETIYAGDSILIEAFDEPYIVSQISKGPEGWTALMPYNFETSFHLESLSCDEWDRFHGVTLSGVPFVLSRPAQAEFFRCVDDYDDDSVTSNGVKHNMPPWRGSHKNSSVKGIQNEGLVDVRDQKFWTQIYREEVQPGWDLQGPHPALPNILPQLKLPRCRILVLGCGAGHDAAFLAEQGHIVTGVDFSDEAITRARSRYERLSTITFEKSDVFSLPEKFRNTFDLVLDHTLYCAIPPERRTELMQVWRKCLTESGQLLGIFFVVSLPSGPPFGGSEWEVRERLKKGFKFHYWTRWRHSPERRKGKELVVFGTKTNRS